MPTSDTSSAEARPIPGDGTRPQPTCRARGSRISAGAIETSVTHLREYLKGRAGGETLVVAIEDSTEYKSRTLWVYGWQGDN